MKFVLGIKPTIITGWGTTFNAKARVRDSIRGCFAFLHSLVLLILML